MRIAAPSSAAEPESGYPRLEQQIRWYDSKSAAAQRCYKWTKIATFVCGGLVPVTATLSAEVTAGLGLLVIVLEGLQQMNQWQHNWIAYRSTCEALRHEKYSYLSRSAAYDGLDEAEAPKLLAERVESLISTEHTRWIGRQEHESRKARQRKAEAAA